MARHLSRRTAGTLRNSAGKDGCAPELQLFSTSIGSVLRSISKIKIAPRRVRGHSYSSIPKVFGQPGNPIHRCTSTVRSPRTVGDLDKFDDGLDNQMVPSKDVPTIK